MDAKVEKTPGGIENIARIILSSKTEEEKCVEIQEIIKDLQRKLLIKNISMNLPAFFNDTCLHLAVRNEQYMVVELLINAGINVNAINKNDRNTALHIAAEKGLTKIFLLLCNQPKMDINSQNINQENVLHICIKKEYIPGINILLTSPFQRIDLFAKNKKNQSSEDLIKDITDLKMQQKINNILFPHYAVLNKDYLSVYKYVTKELPINVTWDGETLLHYAVKEQCFDILLLLCNQKDLQVNIRDNYGRTALDLSIMLCAKPELTRQQYESMTEHMQFTLIKKIREDRLNVVRILVNSSHKFDVSMVNYYIDYVKDNDKKKSIQDALSYSSIHKKSIQKTKEKGNSFFQEIDKSDDSLKTPGIDIKKLEKSNISSEKILENKKNTKKMDFEEIMLQALLWDKGLMHEFKALPKEVLPQSFFENVVKNLLISIQKKQSTLVQLDQEKFMEVTHSIFIERTKNIDENISVFTKQFYLVYSVCQGQFQDDCFQHNSHELYQKTIGLLSNLKPYIILRTLLLLTPSFTKNQFLIMHELVKNILFLNPYFGYSYKDKNFKKLFDIFLSKIALGESVSILSNIRDNLETNRFSMLRQGKKVNNVLDFMQSVTHLIKKDSRDVSLISEAINTFTMEFYKSCPLSAFDLKSDRYKHLQFYIDIYKKLVTYIEYTVLENRDKEYKYCAKVFSFWVKVAENCLYFPWGPDTNALGLILSALHEGNISRVRHLFPLDIKTIKMFDGLSALISPDKKYLSLRKFSKKYPATFPLITLISSDRMMLEEQQLADILSGYGNLYSPIIHLKDKFEKISLKPATNFMQQMMRFAIQEEELYRMSWVIKPDIIDISTANTVGNFYNNFNFFQENRMPLTVIKDAKVLEGGEALTSIEHWLDTLVENDKMKKDAAEKTKQDCQDFVNKRKKQEESPLIKRAATVRVPAVKPPARLLSSLYERSHSPRMLDPDLSESSENLSISSTDNSHGGF